MMAPLSGCAFLALYVALRTVHDTSCAGWLVDMITNSVHLKCLQGRLHHINDGASAPWKSKGEGFCSLFRNLGGDKISLL